MKIPMTKVSSYLLMKLLTNFQPLHDNKISLSRFSRINNVNKPKLTDTPINLINNTMQTANKKSDTEFYIEVYIKNTNPDTGHASASMIKKEKNSSPELVKHMSYVPNHKIPLNAIGAMTCGFFPVMGLNDEKTRDMDVLNANTITRIPLTEAQFNQGLAKIKSIEDGSDNFSNLYAVTAEQNPIALLSTIIVNDWIRQIRTDENFYQKNKYFPAEEDITHALLDKNPLIAEKQARSNVLNCTRSVEEIMSGWGMKVAPSILPGSLFEELSTNNYGQRVENSLVPVNKKDNEETYDDSHVPDTPD